MPGSVKGKRFSVRLLVEHRTTIEAVDGADALHRAAETMSIIEENVKFSCIHEVKP